MNRQTFIRQLLVASINSNASPKDMVARALQIARLAEQAFLPETVAKFPGVNPDDLVDVFYGDDIERFDPDVSSALSEVADALRGGQ